MKRTGVAVVLLLLLVQCKKTSTTNNYITTNHLERVTVEGLTSVNLSKGKQTALLLNIVYNSNTQEKINLAVSELPAGITATFTGPASGYPSFGTSILFSDTSSAPATEGSYNVVLSVTGDGTISKQLPFTVLVLPASDTFCPRQYAGIYQSCRTSTSNFSDTATLDATVYNKLWFRNFANRHENVYALFNCSNGDITLPQQIVGTDTIVGTGNLINTGYGGYLFAIYPVINGVSSTIYFNLR